MTELDPARTVGMDLDKDTVHFIRRNMWVPVEWETRVLEDLEHHFLSKQPGYDQDTLP
jgi:hypothetical protein